MKINTCKSLVSTLVLVLISLYSIPVFSQNDQANNETVEQNSQNKDQLETIVVTATRTEKKLSEVPAAVAVQNMIELQQKGFTNGTDEFRGVPGVFFRQGEGDGEEFPFISIRGTTGNHGNDTFLALIDGVPFVGADEEVLLTEVPYPIIDEIEIVRGPVSALYGRGAIAGAVNYKTQSPRGNRNSIALGLGSDEYYRGNIAIEREYDDFAVLASINYEDSQGWRENSARKKTSAFLKAEMPIGDDGKLTGWMSYVDREAQVPSVIPTLEDGTLVNVVGGRTSFLGKKPTRNNVKGWVGVLRYESQLSDNLGMQLTAQSRQFDSDVRLNFYDYFEFKPKDNIMGVNGFASKNDTKVLYVEGLLNWKNNKHNIVAGLNAEQAKLVEQDRWSGELDPFFSGECGFRFYSILVDYSTGNVINDQPDNACFVRDQLRTAANTTNKFFGAFVQDEISLTDKLTLTLGARFDSFKRDVDFSVLGAQQVALSAAGDSDSVSPKASLAYKLDNGLLYASYGRGFNSNFGPVFQWEPDRYKRDEAPTTIDSYEIGWKGQGLNDRLSWETALFFLEQLDRRIFVNNPDKNGPPVLATTGQKYSSYGLEASAAYKPTDRTSFAFNYTSLNPKWDELIIAGSFGAPDTNYSGNTPQGVPKHIVNLEVSHEFSDLLKARVGYEWYGNYFVDLSNGYRNGGYDLLNMSATYKPKRDKEIFIDFSINNLLDEEYYFYFSGSRTAVTNVTPGAPRQFRMTLRASF